MKFLFVFGLYILFSLSIFCQFSYGPTVSMGYGFEKFNTDNINHFINTYNEFYSLGIKSPLKPFDLMHAFHFNAGFRYMPRQKSSFSWGFWYQYSYAGDKTQSKLWNNAGNRFLLEFHSHDIMAEAGYNIKGKAFIHFLTGMLFRKIQLWSHTVYPDGSLSLANEYDINGYYQNSTNGFYVGGSVGARVWHFFFPLRIFYTFPGFTDQLPTIDYDLTNRFRQNEFPRDYQVFVNDISGTQFETNIIPQEDFLGLRVQLGVEFMIPVFKN